MNFKIGPIIGLIGSIYALIGAIYLLLNYPGMILRVVFSFIWPALGITGAYMSNSGKQKPGGSLLVIAGLGIFLGIFFGLSSWIIIDMLLMILGGILVLMVVEREKDEPREVLTKRKEKRSTLLFVAGSIIIGIACGVIYWDLGLKPMRGWSGIISGVMAAPAYVFGVLLIAYSIHLIGCKWAWLDIPIAIVGFIIILPQMGRLSWDYQLINKTLLFLIIPLNYAVLLILFLVLNRKRTSEKPNSN